jgi:excisionase family DNA binding protein
MNVSDLPLPLVLNAEQAENWDFMTIGQVAHVCDVSTSTVREWVASGRLAVHHVGNELRITTFGLAMFFMLREGNGTSFPKPDLAEND